MSESTPKAYSTDPALYLYTSLTSGSSHIVTGTSRLETILKANRIPFKALDIATDEKARMLWGRRAGKDETGRQRKIPGLVQMGLVVGDLVEIEEWNEYGELKEHITIYHEGGKPASAKPTTTTTPSKAPVLQENKKPETAAAESSTEAEAKPSVGTQPASFTLAMRQVGEEAAQKAKDNKKTVAQTFTGVGKAKAEPEKKEVEKAKAVATPLPLTLPLSETHNIQMPAILQSPTSTAWRRAPDNGPTTQHYVTELGSMHRESLQSPNSTTWKSKEEVGLPAPTVTTYRGSSISTASAEEIRRIEEECAIPEEDEEEDEEDLKN